MLLHLVSILLAALLGGWAFDRLKLPPVMGYILAGAILGNLFGDALPAREFFALGGEIGLVLMLFFIGTELDLSRLTKDWKIAVLGTLMITSASLVICLAIGWFLQWPAARSVFFGFLISLSSTAVVLRILEDFGGVDSPIGRKVLGVLLLQDLLVIPALIVLGVMGGSQTDFGLIFRQLAGGMAVVGAAVWAGTRPRFSLPKWIDLGKDREFRIFAGLVFCLGSATLTGALGLSPALGAFVSGMILGRLENQGSFRDALEPFKILFVAVFFLFVGLIVDFSFLAENWMMVLLIVFLVLFFNTLVTAFVLKLLGMPLVESLATACLLAQIGEFAFLLAAAGQGSGLIDAASYQTAVAVIALSLLFSPLWFALARKLLRAGLGTSATIAFKAHPAPRS